MQARILQQLTGEASAALPPRSSSSQQDMFDLPPLPEDVFNKDRYNLRVTISRVGMSNAHPHFKGNLFGKQSYITALLCSIGVQRLLGQAMPRLWKT